VETRPLSRVESEKALRHLPKVLILAEKPSQARDYAKAFKNCKEKKGYVDCGEVIITWSYGHLFEIDDAIAPKEWKIETLPILPERFLLKLRKGVGSQFKVIKDLLSKVEEVWIGTDPGREGELIAREILLVAGWKGKTKRIWTSEALTPEIVRKAIQNLKDAKEFDSLYFSALARQHSDWLVGINLTRLASLKAPDRKVWSVGRVQTPTLKIICDREEEIRNFKPEPYWIVKALFEKKGKKFIGVLTLTKEDLKRFEEEKKEEEGEEEEEKRQELGSVIKDKRLVFKILSELKPESFGIVEKVIKRKHFELPPLLHSLTSLQREANKLFGFSAEKTLQVAQKLYEERKVISYPRTESQYLASGNKDLVKEILRKLGKEELIPRVEKVGKRVFDDARLTDHHAIIPLAPPPKDLTKEEKAIYDLILRKFLGAFMPPYEYETTLAIIKLGKYTFIARGKVELSLGWKSLYKEEKDEEDLPPLEERERVKKIKVFFEERKTEPPPRYTEGTLLKKMEKLGLGTPATRSSIIETLKKRGYVFVSKKSLVPTEKAFALLKLLAESKVVSPEMTSEWEKKLEEIHKLRKGYTGYKEFLSEIKEFVKSEVKRLKECEINCEVKESKERKRFNYKRK